MKNIHAVRGALLTLLMLSAAPAAMAGDSATVTISATVLAECSVKVDKSSLDLGRIAVSHLKDKAVNAALDGMTGTVQVTSTCEGASKAKMTVSTQAVADKQIVATSPSGGTEDVMRFRLKIDNKAAKFDETKSATKVISDDKLSSGVHTDTLTFSALAGKNASKATAGSYSATVTVKVEPE